jgi:hypothetical protein
MQELEDLLAGTMKMRSYQIILLDDTTRGFKLFHCHPPRTEPDLPDLQVDSPGLPLFPTDAGQVALLQFGLRDGPGIAPAAGGAPAIETVRAGVLLSVFCPATIDRLMLLGPKASGDLFTPHDLRLLTELSSSLGLVLNQIRLRQQLQVVHEQDLLGRMSRGLAHDLNNLLTRCRRLLQLCANPSLNQETIDELLPMGLRNLETVRTYVNEALFFSRSAKLHGKPGCWTKPCAKPSRWCSPAEGQNITQSPSRGKARPKCHRNGRRA